MHSDDIPIRGSDFEISSHWASTQNQAVNKPFPSTENCEIPSQKLREFALNPGVKCGSRCAIFQNVENAFCARTCEVLRLCESRRKSARVKTNGPFLS
jgi:hypothetical protein